MINWKKKIKCPLQSSSFNRLTVLARPSSSATALNSSVTPQSPSSATAEGEEEEEAAREETRAEWSAATAASGSLAASAGETATAAVGSAAAVAAAAVEASIAVGSSRLCCWETAAIVLGESLCFSLENCFGGKNEVVRSKRGKELLHSLKKRKTKNGTMAATTLSPFQQTAECVDVFSSFTERSALALVSQRPLVTKRPGASDLGGAAVERGKKRRWPIKTILSLFFSLNLHFSPPSPFSLPSSTTQPGAPPRSRSSSASTRPPRPSTGTPPSSSCP